jgi:hypothetical protein
MSGTPASVWANAPGAHRHINEAAVDARVLISFIGRVGLIFHNIFRLCQTIIFDCNAFFDENLKWPYAGIFPDGSDEAYPNGNEHTLRPAIGPIDHGATNILNAKGSKR